MWQASVGKEVFYGNYHTSYVFAFLKDESTDFYYIKNVHAENTVQSFQSRWYVISYKSLVSNAIIFNPLNNLTLIYANTIDYHN